MLVKSFNKLRINPQKKWAARINYMDWTALIMNYLMNLYSSCEKNDYSRKTDKAYEYDKLNSSHYRSEKPNQKKRKQKHH